MLSSSLTIVDGKFALHPLRCFFNTVCKCDESWYATPYQFNEANPKRVSDAIMHVIACFNTGIEARVDIDVPPHVPTAFYVQNVGNTLINILNEKYVGMKFRTRNKTDRAASIWFETANRYVTTWDGCMPRNIRGGLCTHVNRTMMVRFIIELAPILGEEVGNLGSWNKLEEHFCCIADRVMNTNLASLNAHYMSAAKDYIVLPPLQETVVGVTHERSGSSWDVPKLTIDQVIMLAKLDGAGLFKELSEEEMGKLTAALHDPDSDGEEANVEPKDAHTFADAMVDKFATHGWPHDGNESATDDGNLTSRDAHVNATEQVERYVSRIILNDQEDDDAANEEVFSMETDGVDCQCILCKCDDGCGKTTKTGK